MTQHQIIYRELAELKEDPNNPNTHPKKQIAQLQRSIGQFGFNCPVLIDEEDRLIAGHGRLVAARALGLKMIPTIQLNHLSPAQKRAFAIADNRVSEGSVWDEAKLAAEFEMIVLLDNKIELVDTGFELAEIDVIIEKSHARLADNAADVLPVAGEVESVARRGDLWLLGRHRLFCGDALDPASYAAVLGDERARMIFTDPPYNVQIDGHVSGLGKVKHSEFEMASGEMSPQEFTRFLQTSCKRMAEVSVDGAMVFMFMDWRHLPELLTAGLAEFDEFKALCVWDKGSGGMGSLYRSQHELVTVFKSGKAPHINNVALGKHGRNRTNVWSYAGMNSFGAGRTEKLSWHPTVKPVGLCGDAILDCSLPGDLILDPFGGSASTLIAAERTRRRAAVIEIDPVYCDRALRRFCDVTGIEPVNAFTGAVVGRRTPKPDGERQNG